jgi:hypothetical protein
MAVTFVNPDTGKIEHHRNPSGTINKANWLVIESKRDVIRLRKIYDSIVNRLPINDIITRQSWGAAYTMAVYSMYMHFDHPRVLYNQGNTKYKRLLDISWSKKYGARWYVVFDTIGSRFCDTLIRE